jgi:cell division protein FtsI/penicillin-binding protein 2
MLAVAGLGALAMRARPPVDWRVALGHLEPRADAGRMVQPLVDGGRVVLTLDTDLQRAAEQLITEADPLQGAAVLLSIDDGRILALAGHARNTPANEARLALEAWAPAASVFKLVTTAALLDAGISADAQVCYHGGVHSVEADNLTPVPTLDGRCRSLGYGLAKSQNAILARLAHEHLEPARLERMARALGFDEPLPFDLAAGTSTVTLPSEALAFARVAAGFWHTTLSPLHGALLAATIARGGEMPVARLVERIVDGEGRVRTVTPTATPRRALDASTAQTLARMMVGTTEWGTANRAFHDPSSHRRRLEGVRIAGKTGTLSDDKFAYSWFVGFAPADNPQVAFAVLLGRSDEDSLRAADVARAMIATWLTSERARPLFARR